MLTPVEYRQLLGAALPAVVDADTIDPNPRNLFTPAGHRNALDPDTTVVRGGRGVGKTVWFKALQDDKLREIAARHYSLDLLNRVDPLPGFGAKLSKQYPNPRRLQALVDRHRFRPSDIWTAVALFGLGVPALTAVDDWPGRVQWVVDNPGVVEDSILDLDEQAGREDRIKLLLFDAMDRLHSDRKIADQLARGIFELALTLRTSTRNLRVKMFIRYDMFDTAKLDFADASKLIANITDLRWTNTSLYALLFHYMGGAESEHSTGFLSETGWTEHHNGDEDKQRKVLERIAGRYMGTDHRKGYTYTWLPNHLADGRQQVSPRSFLSALWRATQKTEENFSGHAHALHWDAIRQGVQHASQIRVQEVKEDTPWVSNAIDPLRGTQVPIERDEVTSRWKNVKLNAALSTQRSMTSELSEEDSDNETMFATGPLSTDYEGLIAELIDLGVMTIRTNKKLDLPDVYRIAFDIGRKGGVPRVKQQ
ncbi:ABC-type cobalamin/Fe3+-siderophore transport system, ATPase component [Actinokineospora spheciospongiae]|uniref:ABC-type cobalamin/Fe3+-siderophore transport system, ATPase component n=1 Tax=Actinokineospora spheciospongiae TaxID=909613 RepID=W7IK32_9PSEU|nr:ABC-type cobalamin/Fe3+-siderophore transport system, ATPase component [Actinokineospora spheciospongiae]